MSQCLKEVNEKLNKLGINSDKELAHYYPRQHEKRQPKLIKDLVSGEDAVVIGIVTDFLITNPRPGLKILSAKITDESGLTIRAKWFRVLPNINVGDKVAVFGRVKSDMLLEMAVKDYDICTDDSIPEDFNGIMPVYPLTKGVSQKFIREKVKTLLMGQYKIDEFLPEKTRRAFKLPEIGQALKNIHFPSCDEALKQARRRLAFDELFLMQLALKLKKDSIVRKPKENRYTQNNNLIYKFIDSLKFKLTSSQMREWQRINLDMSSPFPMRRLLLGDVGSGKTIVAAMALLKAAGSNHQGVLMVPTEVLATQHYETITEWFSPLGVSTALCTSGTKEDTETADVIIGTHALIQEKLNLNKRVGIVIVDEQHRFGVAQRLALQKKAGCPDLLFMTATPIPRTLALAFYGDMSVSIIDEMPPGRIPPQTYITKGKEKAFGLINNELRNGRQCYVVCPMVEESEKVDLQAAISLHKELSERLSPFTVGLVHGRMKTSEKEAVMKDFKDNKYSVLVSTTVVEVGVNVPNATVMVVIDAERFGLAQLHQLRGRVGRGEHKSYCILVSNPKTKQAAERLTAMREYNDGVKLAEIDLKLRGPGEFFGEKQSGLMNLRIADLDNIKMVEVARKTAETIELNQRILKELKDRYKLPDNA